MENRIIEKQTNELKSVNLSDMIVKRTKRHRMSSALLTLCKDRLNEQMQSGLTEDIAEFNFYAFPLMQNLSIASCHIIFNVVCVFLDDHLDRFPADYANWVQYLRTKKFPENDKLANWWRSFMTFAEEAIGGVAVDRLMDILVLCMSKIADVNKIWIGEITPSVDQFWDIRMIDIGLSHQLFFLQLETNVNVTDDLRNDPHWTGLNRQATINFALVNDLYSLKREVMAGGYKFNFVYVKMVNEKLNAQAAVDDIILDIEKAHGMAKYHGDNLKQLNDPNLSRYVDAVLAMLAGHIYWCTVCKRYNKL